MSGKGQFGRNLIAVAIALAIATASGSGNAGAPESEDPIKISVNDWTSQIIMSQLMGGLLERMGYNIEYVPADYLLQFAGAESGDITVLPEIWDTSAEEAKLKGLASGNLVNLGSTGMTGVDFWWYPSYMTEQCPGLPDWTALLDEECAKAFATDETFPKGRYVGGPLSWGEDDDGRVEALGLPFVVIHAGSDTAMFAEVEALYQRQQPIMIELWQPHWAPALYEGAAVEFPAYEPDCYTDPSWGMNPDKLFDCDKKAGGIWKIAWAGGDEKWPKAYAALRKFEMSNDVMSALMAKVDVKGESIEVVIATWFEENEGVWSAWTE